jgi:flagellar basal-body rod modification protein FlgD
MNIQGFNPLMSAPMMAQAANSSATSGTSSTSNTSTSSSTTNDPTSASGLQSTFLNLLVTELQNQDPTQPVDPTEMVSQMVSLNQLDQLISINQTLSSLTSNSGISGAPSTGSTGSSQTATGNAASGTSASRAASGTSAASQKTPQPQPLPSSQEKLAAPTAINPAAWMNLYGNIGVPATYSNHFTAVGGR